MSLPDPPPGAWPYSEQKCSDGRLTLELRIVVENLACKYVLEAEESDRSDDWFRTSLGEISAPLVDHFAGMGGRPMMGEGVGGMVLGTVCPSGGLVEVTKATFDLPWYTLFLNRFLRNAMRLHEEGKINIIKLECKVPDVFTCWQLNYGRNLDSTKKFFYTQHFDRRNAKVNSIGSAIGNYEGGGIWVHGVGKDYLTMSKTACGLKEGHKVRGRLLEQRSQWATFYANCTLHCVPPYRFERFGFVAFSADTALRLTTEKRKLVDDLGFMMPQVGDDRFAKPMTYKRCGKRYLKVPKTMEAIYEKAKKQRSISKKQIPILVGNTYKAMRNVLYGRESTEYKENFYSIAKIELPRRAIGKRMKRLVEDKILWRSKVCDDAGCVKIGATTMSIHEKLCKVGADDDSSRGMRVKAAAAAFRESNKVKKGFNKRSRRKDRQSTRKGGSSPIKVHVEEAPTPPMTKRIRLIMPNPPERPTKKVKKEVKQPPPVKKKVKQPRPVKKEVKQPSSVKKPFKKKEKTPSPVKRSEKAPSPVKKNEKTPSPVANISDVTNNTSPLTGAVASNQTPTASTNDEGVVVDAPMIFRRVKPVRRMEANERALALLCSVIRKQRVSTKALMAASRNAARLTQH